VSAFIQFWPEGAGHECPTRGRPVVIGVMAFVVHELQLKLVVVPDDV
jgi:hypothetical protein